MGDIPLQPHLTFNRIEATIVRRRQGGYQISLRYYNADNPAVKPRIELSQRVFRTEEEASHVARAVADEKRRKLVAEYG